MSEAPIEREEAIELAYQSLKEDSSYWQKGENRGYDSAFYWEHLHALSSIRAGPVVKRDGAFLVFDKDGVLVPKMGGSPGWDSIYDDEKGALLIAKAKDGDPLAHKVLLAIAADFVEGSSPMPRHLREYITEALRSKAEEGQEQRRGPNTYANESRNFFIACTVFYMVRLGFRQFRSRASRDKGTAESACSITAQALARLGVHMSESAVEKIWGQFSKRFLEELASY